MRAVVQLRNAPQHSGIRLCAITVVMGFVACATTQATNIATSRDDHASASRPSDTAPPANGGATASANPDTSDTGTETPMSEAPAFPRIPHEYHFVTTGYGGLVVHEGVPRWFSEGRAIDLRDGRVEFETYDASSGVYLGDGLWYAHAFSPMSACPAPSAFLKLEKGKWRPRLEGNVHDLTVRPWVPGSSLAAIVPWRFGPPWGYELVVLEKNRTPPRAARRTRGQKPECFTRLDRVEGLVTFPSGEIFVLGTECEHLPKEVEVNSSEEGCECLGSGCPPECPSRDVKETTPPTTIEFFATGRHEFLEYPFSEGGEFVGNSPSSLWTTGLVGEGQWGFAHFDGKRWTVLPERYPEQIRALQLPPGTSGPESKRLFRMGKKLLEVEGGKVSEHQLPSGCALSKFSLDGEHLWITCGVDDEKLFTTRADIPELPHYSGSDPEMSLTLFDSKNLKRLDPSAPSLRSCGHSREFQKYLTVPPSRSTSKVHSNKPSATTLPKPGTPDGFGF